jgi:alpha-beta hydrolase superfamily lysophospholipase
MPPSFRRFTEAGIEEVKSRTEDLAEFIEAASKRYVFSRRHLIVVVYSNGANLAASLILLHPHYLTGAVLFRAIVPLVPHPAIAKREILTGLQLVHRSSIQRKGVGNQNCRHDPRKEFKNGKTIVGSRICKSARSTRF